MSSVHGAYFQVPPFKYYKATSEFFLLDENANTNMVCGVPLGTVLRDMGRKVYKSAERNSTMVKVQIIPLTNMSDEANMYQTGYISLGDGVGLFASPVVRLN